MVAPAPAPVRVRALNCPTCGAAIAQRGFDHTRSVVCGACLSVLDATDPSLRVLQTFAGRARVKPLIPLGTRGRWLGATYEAIGFQQRTIAVDGARYSWREYLLFNPFRGFRYLTEYGGHWNDVAALPALPAAGTEGGRPAARYDGDSYRHFQTSEAETTFVLGEFPWEARVGDRAEVRDYIAPPRLISAESTEGETTWSIGEYVSGARVWEAFELPGSPPPVQGVFANQPSPHASAKRTVWAAFALLFAGFVAMAVWRFGAEPVRVLREARQLAPGRAEPYVTAPFTLGGRTSNVEVRIETDVRNAWTFFSLALVNEETGQAIDFAREVGYYEGVEGGESWSEGSRRDRALVPSVPPGRYYLRVAPELAPQAATPVSYTLALRRDVPNAAFFIVAFILLLIPPVWVAARAASFETARWMESDYGSTSGGSDDDD